MENLQKSSLDGKRNQIVMITFLKFVSIFLKYLHACIHGSLSIKIYQMRVNEPTTFNSGLALCLFLSGLFNAKPFFPSHSFHFSQFQQRKSFLFPGLMGNISLVLFCWLVSLDEDSAMRPTLCGLLITSRYLIWYIVHPQ